ncbi:MAG: hypothetical protein RL368_372 [Pseudomonadota bacterium]|jgi:hypothetical protein
MKYLTFIGLAAFAQGAVAADYTPLFDPSTMTLGQQVGEYLEVRDYCPKSSCTTTERQKFVTAIAGRTGRLEIPVTAGNDFEISINMGAYSACYGTDFTVTLYLSDNTSLPLDIRGCGTSLYYPGGSGDRLNWVVGVNDLRLIATQGVLTVSANDTFSKAKLNLTGTVTRIVISKITATEESLFDIRTRGIQKTGATSCPTTTTSTQPTTTTTGNCTATYNASTGRLAVPCVAVPVTQPFGGTQTVNYSIEMQQRAGGFVFDLDLNTVKPR